MNPDSPSARAFLLTPPGVGAMAVIRLQAPDAVDIMRRFFRPNRGPFPTDMSIDRLYYGRFHDDDEVIDDGMVVLHVDSDHSPMADMTVHGGLRVTERMLMRLEQLGAQIESRGTDYFGAANAIDREIAHELPSAKTERAVRFLANQRMLLPAELESIAETFERDPPAARSRLAELAERFRAARRLIEGATITFFGPANSGKSTLINETFRCGRNLTSPRPGTTLDWVDVETAVDGIPLRIVDTAGARTDADATERTAIRSGIERVREADACVVVLDRSAKLPARFLTDHAEIIEASTTVIALNKSDLPPAWNESEVTHTRRPVPTSGLTGAGTEALTAAVIKAISIAGDLDNTPAPFTSRQATGIASILSDASPPDPAGALRSLL